MYKVGDILKVKQYKFEIKQSEDDAYYFHCIGTSNLYEIGNKEIRKIIFDLFNISKGVPELCSEVIKFDPDLECSWFNWDSPDFHTLEMLNRFIDKSKQLYLRNQLKLLN